MQYVGQGFLLLLVVLAGMKTVQVLGNIEPQMEIVDGAGCGTSGIIMREDKLDETATKGKALFMENCAACHKVDKNLTDEEIEQILAYTRQYNVSPLPTP